MSDLFKIAIAVEDEESFLAFVRKLLQLESRKNDDGQSLTDDDFGKLAGITVETSYPTGTVFYKPGDESDAFYIVRSGKVRIVQNPNADGSGGQELAVLTDGEFFGEMGVIEDAPRSAWAVAIEPCSLLKVKRPDFDSLMALNPGIAMKIMVTITKRYKPDPTSTQNTQMSVGEPTASSTSTQEGEMNTERESDSTGAEGAARRILSGSDTVYSFLKSALEWARDTDFGRRQGLGFVSPWRRFAVFLLAGITIPPPPMAVSQMSPPPTDAPFKILTGRKSGRTRRR